MIARKAWPFRGIGLLASGRKVKMFSSENARAIARGDNRNNETIREKFAIL